MSREFFIDVEGAGSPGQLAADFDSAQRRIQARITRTMRIIQRELPVFFEKEAPRDTGELARSIKGIIFFRAQFQRVSIEVSAQREGFNYLDITRFGHRTPYIIPRRKRAMTVHVDGRHNPPILRRRVRGYTPSGDWVRRGYREAAPFLDKQFRELGRDIQRVYVR